MARYPAGTGIEVVVEMAGRPHSIWWFVAGGAEHPENAVTVRSCTYIKRTPPQGDKRDYGVVGTEGYPELKKIDTDRPGPIKTADDVVVARFIVDAPVPFNVFAA